MTDAKPSALTTWLLATRPKTLWASVAPVVIGSAVAHDAEQFHLLSAAAAFAGALLIQIGTNFANDYFDFVKGADTEDRIGPTRATQAGLISPGAMRLAFILTFALALVPGAYIILRGGWPFVVIGMVSIVCGVLYTGGPFPLGYLGLGDLFVLVFFGPVAVCGTYYLQAFEVTPIVAWASLGPGLISVSLLAVNNLRDVDQDGPAGKRTLAVRFGRGFARAEYLACLFGGALAVPLVLYGWDGSRWFVMVPIVTLGLGHSAIRGVLIDDGPALNAVLGTTGKILLVFSIAFSLAWVL